MGDLRIRVDNHWYDNTPVVILNSKGYVATRAYSDPSSGDQQVEVAFFDVGSQSLKEIRDSIDRFLLEGGAGGRV